MFSFLKKCAVFGIKKNFERSDNLFLSRTKAKIGDVIPCAVRSLMLQWERAKELSPSQPIPWCGLSTARFEAFKRPDDFAGEPRAQLKASLLANAASFRALTEDPVVRVDTDSVEHLQKNSRILLKAYLEEELRGILLARKGGPHLSADAFTRLMALEVGIEAFWPYLLKEAVRRYLSDKGRISSLLRRYRKLSRLDESSRHNAAHCVVADYIKRRELLDIEWEVYGLFSPETKRFVCYSLPFEFRCGIPAALHCSENKTGMLLYEIVDYVKEVLESEIRFKKTPSKASDKGVVNAPADEDPPYAAQVAAVFECFGWSVKRLTGRQQRSADLLIEKDGQSGVIQCRSAGRTPSVLSVQESCLAKSYYGTDFAAIVSGSGFPKDLRLPAAKLGVLLLHEAALSDCEVLSKLYRDANPQESCL